MLPIVVGIDVIYVCRVRWRVYLGVGVMICLVYGGWEIIVGLMVGSVRVIWFYVGVKVGYVKVMKNVVGVGRSVDWGGGVVIAEVFGCEVIYVRVMVVIGRVCVYQPKPQTWVNYKAHIPDKYYNS